MTATMSKPAGVDDAPGSPLPPPDAATRVATGSGRSVTWQECVRPYVRPVLALAAVLLAYRVSFQTTLESLSLDTPLAHLALVPLVALALMVVGYRSAEGPPIHDRQLDWILGLPLVLVALAANVLLPGTLSTEFWVYRVDLLSIPFFVAGVVILIFGTRAAWRMRLGVLFLFLAWPYPYAQVLDRWLVPFTTLTVRAVTVALRHISVASAYPGQNVNALFTVTPRTGSPFDLSVASECSGANGLVGFALVGFAFVLALRGRRLAKLAWLLTGCALVWALNVVRILIIFGAGQRWGQKVAIDGFHPVIGLVVFNLGIVVMALLLKRFGLQWEFGSKRARPPAGAPIAPRGHTYRPALVGAAAVVASVAVAVAVLNSDLRNSDLVATSLGSPRLEAFATAQDKPDGWAPKYQSQYDWSKRFFGADSVWRRYVYTNKLKVDDLANEKLQSNAAMIADVITTSDRAAFSNYGIEACYRFHNFTITKRQSVDLGNGVVGGLLTWHDPSTDSTTTTLYWHWPIKHGSKTRWERMTLLVVDSANLTFSEPTPAPPSLTKEFQLRVGDLIKGEASGAVSQRLVATRQFMVAFAEQMITLRGATAK